MRKNQGGAQSMHDSSGRRPKSAGATLRRHGEMAMRQAVKNCLLDWAAAKQGVDRVFLGCSSRARGMFVSKTTASDALKDGRWFKTDERLRNVPMPVRRPTLAECERIYERIARLDVFHEKKKFVLSSE